MKGGSTLRLILGDQLNSQHSWFRRVREDVLYTLMEVRQETDAVRLHIQKVAGFFSAMRHFSAELIRNGHRVEVIQTAIARSQSTSGVAVGIEQLEGFIRQILGWREYMRGIYWAFIHRHRQSLAGNPRVAMMVRTWDRMQPRKRDDLLAQAKQYRAAINEL